MIHSLFRSPLTDPRSHALRCALLGGAIVAVRLAWWPGWAVAALLFAVFVTTPLGLALINPNPQRTWHAFFWRIAVWLQLPAALALLSATLVEPQGDLAGLLALPWLLVTSLVALAGLARLLGRGVRPLRELIIDVAMIYLAVGGVWTVLAFWGSASLQSAFREQAETSDLVRVAMRSVGFPQIVFELTAVHFHFAGFVLPLLTGMVGRARPGVAPAVAAVGIIAAVPLVAVGITLTQLGTPEVEPWAAWLLAASATITGVLHLWHAGRTASTPQRWLFTVSGLSLIVAMAYAALYAWGLYSFDRLTGQPSIDIARMLPFHGAVNALGFALVGLVAWLVSPTPEETRS